MTALFDTSSSTRNNKNLVEFRAGKMIMKGKVVHPDKRKGLVYIHQSDDSLMHFCWKDRSTGAIEDDLIIFPDDIEFKHVVQCVTGRVYVLKFKSSSRKFFFWLQEPKTDKDEENCKKVNEFLNNPPAPGSSRGGGSGSVPSDLASLGEPDLQSILGGMSQQQLMQLLGGIGVGSGTQASGLLNSLIGRHSGTQSSVTDPPLSQQPSTARAASGNVASSFSRPAATNAVPTQQTSVNNASTTGSGGAAASISRGAGPHIQLSDLQNILSAMNVPTDEAGQEVDLAKALNPEDIVPILANTEVQKRLIPFLPQGESTPSTEDELHSTIHSPQFQQSLSSFSSALQSGQLGPLMSQFGLGKDVVNAAAQGDMEAFVKAMQEAVKKSDEDRDDSMEH